jgi:polysaccharide export outer membrane protein
MTSGALYYDDHTVIGLARLTPLLVCAGVALAGCASTGQYVWYRDLPRTEQAAEPAEYVIGVGDVVSVRVYDQESLATRVKIRSDGRIALPFADEILAAGKHPSALARDIEARLKAFINSPRVTVNVEESRPLSVSVLGEVGHAGTLTLDRSAGILEALAQSGGPSDFASGSKIFVLRRFPVSRRIRFTYEALVQNEGGAATFPLQNGDVIVVE